MSSSENGCVVVTAPLTSAIRAFLERWELDRPSDPWQTEFLSGMEWLAGESGLSEDALWIVRRGRYRVTAFSTADRIVAALGHEEWFYDGTLTVIPNPNAPRALREECCGGSTGQDAPASTQVAA